MSEDSSEEEENVDYFTQANADVDAIVTTPRSQSFRLAEYLRFGYEEGGRIEMPWYTAQKVLAKKEAPVSKVHEKKNFKGLHESEEVATNLVRNSLKTQSETLKERLQQRKLQMFRRRQTIRANAQVNKTMFEHGGERQRLDSPNMSRSK